MPDPTAHSSIEELREAFRAQLSTASTDQALKRLNDAFLSRKSGSVTALLKSLGTLASRALAKEHAEVLTEIDERHDALAEGLGLSAEESAAALSADRKELRELVEGVALVGELTPRTRARLLRTMGGNDTLRAGVDVVQSALSPWCRRWQRPTQKN